MERKSYFRMGIFSLFLISALIVGGYSRGEIDEEAFFEKRLSRALIYSKKAFEETGGLIEEVKPANLKKVQRAAGGLRTFVQKFPDNKYSDDAQYFNTLLPFVGAALAGDEEQALAYIKSMQEVAQVYPDGKLEELSHKRWKEIFGREMTYGVIYIPYQYTVTYMRGFMCSQFGDLESAIYNFSILKNRLNFDRDESGMLSLHIYSTLIFSYQKLDRLEEASSIAKEAIDKFPNNMHLRRIAERIMEKTQSYP